MAIAFMWPVSKLKIVVWYVSSLKILVWPDSKFKIVVWHASKLKIVFCTYVFRALYRVYLNSTDKLLGLVGGFKV
jgi:hypothetical protein